MEKEKNLGESEPNTEYERWTGMDVEEHETTPDMHRTLEVYEVKRGGKAKDIADQLASNGFKEEAIRYHSFPLWGTQEGVLDIINVKGDLAVKYKVFSSSEEDRDIYESKKESKGTQYTFIDLPNDYTVDVFDNEELSRAESGARSIEEQCREVYDDAPIAGEYKIVDFTNFACKDSAKKAEEIIRDEKVFNAESKDDVKLIFLKPTGASSHDGVPYMDIEVVQPDLEPYQASVEQSNLPYNTSIQAIEHTGYGTGGIHGVPVTEKETLVNTLRNNYEKSNES